MSDQYSRRSFLAGVLACGTISAATGYLLTDRSPAEIELRLASGADPTGARNQLIDSWNRANPGIKVIPEVLTSETVEQKKTMSDLARAGQVDIVNLDVIHIPEFARAGLIVPIELHNSNEFLESMLRLVRLGDGGELWAAPFNADVGMLFQRVSGPPGPVDVPPLSELLDHQVTDRSGQFVGQLRPETSTSYEVFVVNILEHALSRDETILTREGRVSTDLARWRRALTPLREHIRRGRITSATDEDDSLARFDRLNLSYMRNWPVRYRYLQQAGRAEMAFSRVQISAMPHGVLGGQSLALVARSRHAEQALRVIQFLTDTPMQKVLAMHGLAPTRIGAYNDPTLRLLMPQLDKVRGAVENGRPRPIHPNYGQFSTAVYEHTFPFLHQDRELTPEFMDAVTIALKP